MKSKFYVVWQGKVPGIYTNWADCQAQVSGFGAARYKAFATRQEAEAAVAAGPEAYIAPRRAKAGDGVKTAKSGARGKANEPLNPPDYRHDTVLPLPPEVEANAWAVDAACSGNPGKMEYRGVDLRTGAEVFRFGPIFGTNNIGEFLAIVHALALLEQRGETLTIYSDSRNAQLWIRQRRCKTKLTRNAKTEAVYTYIERAERWLQTHSFTNKIQKWKTDEWGEIPADFGRK